MSEFLRIGDLRVRLDQVLSVTLERDGSVALHLGTGHLAVTGEDAAAVREWVEKQVVNPAVPEAVPVRAASAPAPPHPKKAER